jgi:hypothetical protein
MYFSSNGAVPAAPAKRNTEVSMKKRMNWSQARKDTDSGKTHDKVNFPDPAAAPLGTDEEAGGARTAEEDIAESERHLRPGVNKHRPGEASAPPKGQR